MKGLKILQPKVFADERGHFYESYNRTVFQTLGIKEEFVQDNQSLSQKGIIRGLHFQRPPFAQAKLVRVIKGAVLDVVVDIRKTSGTYGKFFAIELTETNFTSLFIPTGFAHGFATLQDNTIFSYKCTAFYHPESEGGIAYNCPTLNINWGIDNPILSNKDLLHPNLTDFQTPFE